MENRSWSNCSRGRCSDISAPLSQATCLFDRHVECQALVTYISSFTRRGLERKEIKTTREVMRNTERIQWKLLS
jgi:hypothetical protein